MYLVGSIAAFAIAGLVALLMRMELSHAGPTITNPNTYNVWLYFHGAAMILGFQIPALTGFFANYLIPLQIGAKDVAFPRLNAFSLWLFWMGIILALATFVIPNPPDIMWTGYPPYSIMTAGNTAFYTFTVLILGFASIAGGINLICTIIFMRAPNVTWNKLNMFVWATLAAFVLQLIFVPVLGTAVTLITLDKYLGTHFFDPAAGGDVLIYQNLFWFYTHPAVYVIFLPFIGVIFEIVTTFARNAVFNYKAAVYGGLWGVALMSGEVWVHHNYVTGLVDWVRVGMMVTTLMISVPVGLLVISLVGTLYRGSIDYKTPMLWAVGFMFMFLIGGLTGIPLAMISLDLAFQDTQFVTAHFHYVMAVSGTFSILGGVYYIFPKMSGKMYNETLGKIAFFITFIGMNYLFMAMFLVGMKGMPRRYFDYTHLLEYAPEIERLQQHQTYGAYIVAVGVILILVGWIHGLIAGEKAPDNPWGSKSLEWTHTPTPPGPGNFGGKVPELSEDWSPYGYGK
jgi:cytochrome c oxidase subunit 1